MKNTILICIILVFSTSIICKSSAMELPKHKDILKTKTTVCTAGNNMTVDSIPNYSVTINGKQNTVKIKSDSLSVQTTESISNNSKDGNTIEINGKGNSVEVSQETKGKVAVKQNGKNNRVSITQTPIKP